VQDSIEAKTIGIKQFEAQIKAFQAETQRISAVQESMSPEQIQDIVHGTIAAAIDTGDLIGGASQMEMPEMPEMQEMQMEQQMPMEQPQMPSEEPQMPMGAPPNVM
jgi:hypothetical protein